MHEPELSSWEYWRDDYGQKEAIERFYPSLKRDPVIANALALLQVAALAIEGRVKELQDGVPDDEY